MAATGVQILQKSNDVIIYHFLFYFLLRGGYGTDFDFRDIRAPFAAMRTVFNQIHQTKFYKVFQHIYEYFHKKSFFGDVPYWGNPLTKKIYFFKKCVTPKVSQVAFLNIFSKFQKEVFHKINGHLTTLGIRAIALGLSKFQNALFW